MITIESRSKCLFFDSAIEQREKRERKLRFASHGYFPSGERKRWLVATFNRLTFERDDICEMCDEARPDVLHHRTYKRYYEEKDEDFSLLCGNCHRKAHIFKRHFFAYGWLRKVLQEDVYGMREKIWMLDLISQ